MKICGNLKGFRDARAWIYTYYWGFYLSAMEKKKLQSNCSEQKPEFELTEEEELAFRYFNKGETKMLEIMDGYTEGQKEFLIRKYKNAYLSARTKLEEIRILERSGRNMGDLDSEHQLTYVEKAALRFVEKNPDMFIALDEKVRTL